MTAGRPWRLKLEFKPTVAVGWRRDWRFASRRVFGDLGVVDDVTVDVLQLGDGLGCRRDSGGGSRRGCTTSVDSHPCNEENGKNAQ